MAGIYIHIPFCKQACSYCNFYFLTRKELAGPFVDALIREIEHYGNHPIARETIETIYIGGGTPSLLSGQQLKKIFTALKKVFRLDTEEVTIEMNPDDVTESYLMMLRDLGVDRASMGVQSFDPDLLLFMHRAHNPDEAKRALELLHKANFPSFTADLIYGNPGQTLAGLSSDIDSLLRYDPPHISAYSLTIESGTRLGRQVELGNVQVPGDDEVAAHFDLVEQKLSDYGLRRYEVSNFAKPGQEAVHNSNYWRHVNYLGLGPSAHSLYWIGSGAQRWNNKRDIKKYLSGDWDEVIEEETDLNLHDLAEERLMLGLRTIQGVSIKNLMLSYSYNLTSRQQEWMKKQKDDGFFELEGDTIRLSKSGLRIADYLILELISRH